MKDEKLKRAIEFLKEVNDGLTREEFVAAFKEVLNSISALEKRLTATNAATFDSSKAEADAALKEAKAAVAEAKSELKDFLKEAKRETASSLSNIRQRALDAVQTLFSRLGLQGQFDSLVLRVDGKLAEADAKLELIKPQTPETIRDGLETLQGEARLDKTAIRGVEDIEERVSKIELRPAAGGGGGGKGFQLYVDGSRKGLTAQALNLIAGSGVTLSYAHRGGRNDVTITASGSASLTPITVSGTIDDSNTAFTAASAPNIVIVNGAAYRNGHGCTISGTSITLDNPVGVSGDIYCL